MFRIGIITIILIFTSAWAISRHTATDIIRFIADNQLFGKKREDVQCAHKKLNFEQEEETVDAGEARHSHKEVYSLSDTKQ